MKHVKMLGLLVMAAASLMAFASSAMAAPTLTSPAGTEYTGGLEATLTSGTSALLKAGIEDTCTSSSVSGNVTTNTEAHAKGAVGKTGLSFTNCTKDTTVLAGGELTIAANTGSVTATGFEVTVNDTGLGISCVYGASTGLVLGTLSGGTPATLAISTTKLKKISGSFFCASEGTWTANYTVTKPGTLLVS